LIAIPANCPDASRRVVNDWDCNGSCHLKFFDHPRKPIKSVAHLQFAGGHIGQFRENDRRIIHSVWYFKSPPVGSESSDLESATKSAGVDYSGVVTHQRRRLHQTDAPLLRAIEEALARIKQGTFGVCQEC
jgi:hypothetical protein